MIQGMGNQNKLIKIHTLHFHIQIMLKTLNNLPIPPSQNVRYLSLQLDKRLTWAHRVHTNSVLPSTTDPASCGSSYNFQTHTTKQ